MPLPPLLPRLIFRVLISGIAVWTFGTVAMALLRVVNAGLPDGEHSVVLPSLVVAMSIMTVLGLLIMTIANVRPVHRPRQ